MHGAEKRQRSSGLETEKREIELVEFSTLDELMAVFGPYDANVSLIERALDVSFVKSPSWGIPYMS